MGRWAKRHPDILPNPVPIYDGAERYPGRLRVLFADGRTEIYVIQPKRMPIRDTLLRIRNMGREEIGYKKCR